MNANFIDSIDNSKGFDSKTVTLLLRSERFFSVALSAGKSCDSFWCGVSGLVAASPIGLLTALLGRVGKVGEANCMCFERIGLLRVPVCCPSLSCFFDLERSCTLTGGRDCCVHMTEGCGV